MAVLAILSALARDTENRRHFFYCVEKMGTLHETKQHESAESARGLTLWALWANILLRRLGDHPKASLSGALEVVRC